MGFRTSLGEVGFVSAGAVLPLDKSSAPPGVDKTRTKHASKAEKVIFMFYSFRVFRCECISTALLYSKLLTLANAKRSNYGDITLSAPACERQSYGHVIARLPIMPNYSFKWAPDADEYYVMYSDNNVSLTLV
jgi:hypothetical protein